MTMWTLGDIEAELSRRPRASRHSYRCWKIETVVDDHTYVLINFDGTLTVLADSRPYSRPITPEALFELADTGRFSDEFYAVRLYRRDPE
jgi:hypothetical protein